MNGFEKALLGDTIALMQCAPHTPEGKAAAFAWAMDRLTRPGIRVERHETPEGPVLTAEVGPEDGPVVAWIGHLDVVPGDCTAVIDGGLLRGRGAADMLSGVAAGIHALEELRDQSRTRVRLILVCDEEDQLRHSIEYYFAEHPVAFALALEPTANQISLQSMGAIFLEVAVTGVSAHSARPHEGKNAILRTLTLAKALESLPCKETSSPWFPKGPAIAVTRIEGGSANNVVPELCRMTVSVRFLPGQTAGMVIDEIYAIAADLDQTDPEFRGAKVTVSNPPHFPAVAFPVENPYIEALSRALIEDGHPVDALYTVRAGSSDAALAPCGGVEFGPDGAGHHGTGERVVIASIAALARQLVLFARYAPVA